jgi:hypothetical protein
MRAVAFVGGAVTGWRVDFDEETGKTITGWLGPRDDARASQITTEHLRSGCADDGNAAIGRSSLAPFHWPISSLVIDLFWGEIVRHPHIRSTQ